MECSQKRENSEDRCGRCGVAYALAHVLGSGIQSQEKRMYVGVCWECGGCSGVGGGVVSGAGSGGWVECVLVGAWVAGRVVLVQDVASGWSPRPGLFG